VGAAQGDLMRGTRRFGSTMSFFSFLTTKRVAVGGHVMRVPRDMAWCFEDGDYYEKSVVHWFSRIVDATPDPVIYDVGANYGYFSLRFAHCARAVYAFEPVARTFEVLEHNVQDNGLRNVRAFRLGLAQQTGEMRIHVYSSSGNNSLYRRKLPPGHSLKLIGTETVRVVRLDEIVDREALLPPSVVKIDVEGAELDVLRGGASTFRTHRPFVLLEFGETASRDAGYSGEDLLRELEGHGYRLLGLSGRSSDLALHAREAFDRAAVSTVIAVPPGRHL
jgi:FkbM family methyltransferase